MGELVRNVWFWVTLAVIISACLIVIGVMHKRTTAYRLDNPGLHHRTVAPTEEQIKELDNRNESLESAEKQEHGSFQDLHNRATALDQEKEALDKASGETDELLEKGPSPADTADPNHPNPAISDWLNSFGKR